MDPLSDVLAVVRPRSYMSAGFDAAGAWSVRFPAQEGTIKTGAMVSGHCWLALEDGSAPRCLEPGDSFLLPHGRAFRLASDPALPPAEASVIFAGSRNGGIVTYNGGGDVFLVSSRFTLDGAPTGDGATGLLPRLLPPLVHIRGNGEPAALRWSVERMMEELRTPQPGSALVIRHLAHLMLLQALRQHLAEAATGDTGWLAALADPRLGAAISALHDDPARRWTVETLARRAGLSRSVFAQRFRETVGTSPMDYLTRWRMLLASDRLRQSDEPVSAIALSLGYESESAFSTAFKRVMGSAPRRYGQPRSETILPG